MYEYIKVDFNDVDINKYAAVGYRVVPGIVVGSELTGFKSLLMERLTTHNA